MKVQFLCMESEQRLNCVFTRFSGKESEARNQSVEKSVNRAKTLQDSSTPWRSPTGYSSNSALLPHSPAHSSSLCLPPQQKIPLHKSTPSTQNRFLFVPLVSPFRQMPLGETRKSIVLSAVNSPRAQPFCKPIQLN